MSSVSETLGARGVQSREMKNDYVCRDHLASQICNLNGVQPRHVGTVSFLCRHGFLVEFLWDHFSVEFAIPIAEK